jgi:hypothetical protein
MSPPGRGGSWCGIRGHEPPPGDYYRKDCASPYPATTVRGRYDRVTRRPEGLPFPLRPLDRGQEHEAVLAAWPSGAVDPLKLTTLVFPLDSAPLLRVDRRQERALLRNTHRVPGGPEGNRPSVPLKPLPGPVARPIGVGLADPDPSPRPSAAHPQKGPPDFCRRWPRKVVSPPPPPAPGWASEGPWAGWTT